MECNVPNKNGRIYTIDMMKEAIEKYRERYKPYGIIIGELSHNSTSVTDFSFNVDLRNVSHRIDNLYFENDCLYIDGIILNTPCGKIVQKNPDDYGFELVGTCESISDGEVKGFNIGHIDLILKDYCAWSDSYIKIVEQDENTI